MASKPGARDYHDIVRASVAQAAASGPFRLCPGLVGPRPGPPPAPTQLYEQLLAAEPVRIRPRSGRLPAPEANAPPPPQKPASIDTVYDLLSDGIFSQRIHSEPAPCPIERPAAMPVASKQRRAPTLRTFIGG